MFAVVSLALLMQSIDSTIVATALHTLQHGLHASVNLAGWTITAYAFGLLLMLPLMATFTDRFGRRRVFLASVALFALASLFCGFAGDIYTLIALRALQAAGGAGLTPSATGIVVEYFGAARDRAVGLFGSIFSIGGILGPLLGGVVVAYLSWRWIFFVNVPISLILIVMGLKTIPADRKRDAASSVPPLDLTGMAMLGVGLLAGMVGITNLGESGARLWLVAVLLAVSAAMLALFLRHVRHAQHPLVPPQLIYGRGFGAVNVLNVLYNGALVGMVSLVPLYAVNRYHISVLNSATLLTAEGIAIIVASLGTAFALRRTGYRLPLYGGGLLVAVGMFALATGPRGMSAYAWLATASFVVGFGAGLCNPSARNAGLQLAPGKAGTLAALRSMGIRIGLIASVAVATAILASSGDPGAAQAYIFAAFAVLVLAALAVVARIPEHRGMW